MTIFLAVFTLDITLGAEMGKIYQCSFIKGHDIINLFADSFGHSTKPAKNNNG